MLVLTTVTSILHCLDGGNDDSHFKAAYTDIKVFWGFSPNQNQITSC